MKKDLRIVYMGTPEFACAGLEILIKNNYNIVGVITAPDKKSGRGQKITPSPVKETALEHELNILQPTNLKDPEFIEELKSLNANLQIVVAFRMLPEMVWNMPEIGTFNLHASLLPQYRGAAPINWALINGETQTGVTTFFLKHEIDTGDILFQDEVTILPDENVGGLYNKLMNIGSETILKTVKAIEEDNYKQIPQQHSSDLKAAPKIFKDTCKIDWNQSAQTIFNFIRGLSPYPVAWTEVKEKTCKIYEATVTDTPSKGAPGTIESDGKTFFHFNTADLQLKITRLQLQGKKQLPIEDFLRGYQL
ncbi:methionyl-tRNA formyltransferase [Cyclobacteriaceae bacterium]|nr:methionyl-tRNA formyltransferase [Cyclobacteriaceae bacterium]